MARPAFAAPRSAPRARSGAARATERSAILALRASRWSCSSRTTRLGAPPRPRSVSRRQGVESPPSQVCPIFWRQTSSPPFTSTALGRPLGGFDFELSQRNARLSAGASSSVLPKAHKTGTTICGTTFAGGVVLGADTRATEGTIVRCRDLCAHRRAARAQTPRALTHLSLPLPHPHCRSLGLRQELREDPLHRAQHLLLRRRHVGRHGEHDGARLEQAGAAAPRHGHELARRHGHDDAQALPLPLPGPRVGCARAGRRRRDGRASLHCLPARQHRQAALWCVSMRRPLALSTLPPLQNGARQGRHSPAHLLVLSLPQCRWAAAAWLQCPCSSPASRTT